LKSRIGCFVAIGVILLLVIIIGASLWGTYNSLVTKSQAIDAQWAQVETQYQRRFDLIPNLVDTLKSLYKQEQVLYDKITEARSKYAGAPTPDLKAAAGSELENLVGSLLAIVEDNPEIKSNVAVTTLMDELAGTENRISIERQRYNTSVQDYNTTIKRFPTNLLASMFGFESRQYFQADSEASTVPKVDF